MLLSPFGLDTPSLRLRESNATLHSEKFNIDRDIPKVSELCRKHGMSDATLYKWKAKYGGLTVSELRRLKDLEAENSELKRLLADAMLDNAGLKGLLAKNS